MKSPSIADIFLSGIDQYQKQFGPLPRYQRKVVQAIMACRTPIMGGHVYKCDSCGHENTLYHSCRNRHCPQCQSARNIQWINCRINELLPVPYFHVVFTLPQQLNEFALRNRGALYRILFKAVKETMLELAEDPKRLGAAIGIVAVLHTWGQNLMEHPHLHCIVPGGGMDKKYAKWKTCKNQFLFPIAVVQKLFRGKFIDYFKQAIEAKDILLHGTLKKYEDRTLYKYLLNLLYTKKWVVYIKQPFASPKAVVKYLGQYTHRIAISNKRIIAADDTKVSFQYKDYAHEGKSKIMTVSVIEFIRRFLMHIVPKRFVRIRYYGYLANRNRKIKLNACLALFRKKQQRKVKCSLIQTFKELLGIDVSRCPICRKGVMSILASVRKLPLIT